MTVRRRSRTKKGATEERSIIIASNRLPFTYSREAGVLKRKPSPGGLVSALEPVLQKRGGTWIGWPGITLHPGERISSRAGSYRVEPVKLAQTEVKHYYHGFSNGTLWPLFHSLPVLTRFERKDWTGYETVNQLFAEAVRKQLRKAELV